MTYRYPLGSILVGVVAVAPLLGDAATRPTDPPDLSAAISVAMQANDWGQRMMSSTAARPSGQAAERVRPDGDSSAIETRRSQTFPESSGLQNGAMSAVLAGGTPNSHALPAKPGSAQGRLSIASARLPEFNVTDPSPAPAALFLLGGFALLLGLAGQLRSPASCLPSQDSDSSGE